MFFLAFGYDVDESRDHNLCFLCEKSSHTFVSLRFFCLCEFEYWLLIINSRSSLLILLLFFLLRVWNLNPLFPAFMFHYSAYVVGKYCIKFRHPHCSVDADSSHYQHNLWVASRSPQSSKCCEPPYEMPSSFVTTWRKFGPDETQNCGHSGIWSEQRTLFSLFPVTSNIWKSEKVQGYVLGSLSPSPWFMIRFIPWCISKWHNKLRKICVGAYNPWETTHF